MHTTHDDKSPKPKPGKEFVDEPTQNRNPIAPAANVRRPLSCSRIATRREPSFSVFSLMEAAFLTDDLKTPI
ncbi:hypothetical protein BDI4_670051 [Burkholderia diffusa]|nr:hypothetical protein BDI4_670051 [Burkholderia diffusa]